MELRLTVEVEQEVRNVSEVLAKQNKVVLLDLEEADRPLMNGCAEKVEVGKMRTRTSRTMTPTTPILFTDRPLK